MIWLQTFVFLVSACLIQAQYGCSSAYQRKSNDTGPEYKDNSYPYYHLPLQVENKDIYTSSIVSLSAGPLCSGFHLSPKVIITAASCVLRQPTTDLVVISHSLEDPSKPKLLFLPINDVAINPKYNFRTDEHNLAVLLTDNIAPVPILRLPALGDDLSKTQESNIFMAKYSYSEKVYGFSSLTIPVSADLNIRKCTNASFGVYSFFCVSRTDEQPYSYGLMDLGTPLINKNPDGDFVSGMFTGHVYNELKEHYLYQNMFNNLDFVFSYMKTNVRAYWYQ